MRSSKCGQRARNFALSSASVFTLPQHNADKYSWVSNYDDTLIYLQSLNLVSLLSRANITRRFALSGVDVLTAASQQARAEQTEPLRMSMSGRAILDRLGK